MRKLIYSWLLVQHLMSFLLNRKIAQYSPSESTKLYDKAMQRRTIPPFNPKATIALLKEDPRIGTELNENEKRVLVDRYLEVSFFYSGPASTGSNEIISLQKFKQLMIRLDPEEEGDDDDQPLAKTPQKVLMPPPNTSQGMSIDVTMNHQYMNNVQINLPRLPLPMAVDGQQNFVSFYLS